MYVWKSFYLWFFFLENFIGHGVHDWHYFSCLQLFNNSLPARIVSKDSAGILTSGTFGCTVFSFLGMLLSCYVCCDLSALVTMPVAVALIMLPALLVCWNSLNYRFIVSIKLGIILATIFQRLLFFLSLLWTHQLHAY